MSGNSMKGNMLTKYSPNRLVAQVILEGVLVIVGIVLLTYFYTWMGATYWFSYCSSVATIALLYMIATGELRHHA